jgi:hypothetical protein
MTGGELERRFRLGHAPEPTRLLCPDGGPAEWRVDMLTGPIPNMGGWPLHHRKWFDDLGGCNLLRGYRWGQFEYHSAVYSRKVDGDGGLVLCLDYDVPEIQFKPTRRIVDYVRTTYDPDVMLGRFHVRWRGRLRFLGYFSLTRV